MGGAGGRELYIFLLLWSVEGRTGAHIKFLAGVSQNIINFARKKSEAAMGGAGRQ
jgi:hypothetical protein